MRLGRAGIQRPEEPVPEAVPRIESIVLPAPKTVTLEQAIEEYRMFLRHEQNASPQTQKGYASGLRRFTRFLTARCGAVPPLAQISVEDCREYLYDLSGRGLRPRTLRGAMYPLRGLFALAQKRGHMQINPAAAVGLPKKDPPVRARVREEELDQLLQGCRREPDGYRRAKMKAVLSVLIHCALRRQELLDLQRDDVDLHEKKLLVRAGKGDKSRVIYMCDPAVEALRDWLKLRPEVAHPYLFLADRSRRLGDVGLNRLLQSARCLADLQEHDHIKPHAMRHAAATRLMRRGADLRSIQQFLGHSQLQTTAIYLHTDEAQLRKIAPLAALEPEEPVADTRRSPRRSFRRDRRLR